MDDEIQNRLKQASFGHLRRKVFLNSNLNLHFKILVHRVSLHLNLTARHGPFAATISEAWRPSMYDAFRRSSASHRGAGTGRQLQCGIHPEPPSTHGLGILGTLSHRLPHKVYTRHTLQQNLGLRSASRFKDQRKTTLKRSQIRSLLEELGSCYTL